MLDMLVFATNVARESRAVRVTELKFTIKKVAKTVQELVPLEIVLKLLFTFQTKEIAVKCLRLLANLIELGMSEKIEDELTSLE